MDKNNVTIVLVEPQNGGNVGRTCRAMASQGFCHLSLVCEEGGLFDYAEATAVAGDTIEILRNAERFVSLKNALNRHTLIAGTTRRWGQKRKQMHLSPRQFAERIADTPGGRFAIVFGNEVSGLSVQELEICHLAVTIPSSPSFPSLNLSHAVFLMAYEMAKSPSAGRPATPVISDSELDGVIKNVIRSINAIGFLTQEGPQGLGQFLREICARASLTADEATHLVSLFGRHL